mgnify:CR=1 FL=1
MTRISLDRFSSNPPLFFFFFFFMMFRTRQTSTSSAVMAKWCSFLNFVLIRVVSYCVAPIVITIFLWISFWFEGVYLLLFQYFPMVSRIHSHCYHWREKNTLGSSRLNSWFVENFYELFQNPKHCNRDSRGPGLLRFSVTKAVVISIIRDTNRLSPSRQQRRLRLARCFREATFGKLIIVQILTS